MSNALDRSWSALLGGLPDNNEGAITEEDVRAIAAYGRHSSFEQAFGEPTVGSLSDATWANYPEPVDNLPYTLLQAQRAGAAQVYQHYTGHLAEVSGLGARYVEGTPSVDGVTQPRQFTIDWSVSVEAPYNTLWAVTLWRLADGGTWPGPLDAWPEDEIFPIGIPAPVGSVLVRVENGANVWGASASGSATVTLNPGDTIVPVLEFLGTLDSTSSTPDGTLKVFTLRVASAGPVEGDWDGAPVLGSAANLWALTRGDEVRQAIAADTDLVPTGGLRQSLVILPEADSLPTTGNYNGRFYWDEETEKLNIWKDGEWLTYTPDPYQMPTVTTRPTTGLYEGMWIYESSTGMALLYSNSTWLEFSRDGKFKVPGCILRRSSVDIAHDTQVKLAWNSEDRDVGGFHVADSTDIVVPTGLGGLYHVNYTVYWNEGASSQGNGRRQSLLYKNNAVQSQAALRQTAVDDVGATNMTAAGDIVLVDGDTLDLRIAQTAGVGVSISSTAILSLRRIGDN